MGQLFYKKFLSIINKGDQRSIVLKKNVIASLCIKAISILVSLLLVPITLGYVNSELYGIWLTISSVIMWLSFFDVGFTLGLKNKLAEALAHNDVIKAKTLVSTTYFMMVIIFIPLLIILELFIPHVCWSSFLNISNIYEIEVRNALYVLIACFCLQMVVQIILSVIAAFQQVALSSIFPVIGNIISLLVIIGLSKSCEPSLLSLAFAISAVPIFVLIIASAILYNGRYRMVKPTSKFINTSYIKNLWSLGYKFFLIQIQVVVMFQATNIIISNVSGPSAVTEYNIVYKYLNVAMLVYNIILTPLWPAFTDAYAKKDYIWMTNIYKKLTNVFYISATMMTIMLIISPFVYKIWIGERADISFSMNIAVFFYMIITTWNNLQTMTLNGIGAVKIQTIVSMIGLFAHIPLSFFLGQFLGGEGVIASMTIITLIYALVFTKQVRLLLKQNAYGIWSS